MAPKNPVSAVLGLPLAVITHTDVARLKREVEAVDDFLRQMALRQSGTNMVLPRTSPMLEEFVRGNNLNMLQQNDRARLIQFLGELKDKAPLIHISKARELFRIKSDFLTDQEQILFWRV